MYPFWETVVAPLVAAAGARRIVEIGALRGDTTVRMLGDLAPDAELHVIDPVPQFDPAEHEAAFPGRYVFHRGLSLDVLPGLGAVDVALIDGDHNWYTVRNELRLLAEAARDAGRPLPLLVLHDVAWPYGWRDLYYAPEQIPTEARQPHAKAGIVPGQSALSDDAGINRSLDNATSEGGPRNGVRRALEDFLADHDRPTRHVHLPIYFGLSIVVEADRVAEAPEVGRLLDHLETAEGRLELLGLSEQIRIDAVVQEHAQLRVVNDALLRRADRSLELLKSGLLDEHHLENEVRLEYLLGLGPGARPDPVALHDPARRMPLRTERVRTAREQGRATTDGENLSSFPATDMGRAQLDHLQEAMEALTRVRDRGDGVAPVEGDVAECGVGRGGGAIFLRGFVAAHELVDRDVWVIDDLRSADLALVRDGFHRFSLLDTRVRFATGAVAEVAADQELGPLALLRVGGTALGPSLEAALDGLLPKVAPGGCVVVEGTGDPAVAEIVHRARDRHPGGGALVEVDWNAVTWTVGAEGPSGPTTTTTTTSTDATTAPSPAATGARIASVARRAPDDEGPLDLSVVVVTYGMRREAARTLRSLTRTYQQGIDELAYEVIVVDNGSAPGTALTAAEVAAYGPQFRLLEMGADATPSPTGALNRGIAEARGQAVALMIDGAHVLTPGVLAHAVRGLDGHEPAIVAIQQWYVGPGQQGDAQVEGYDEAAEDELFDAIEWPVDGYRLFEIGHFIGDRDWFDGMAESNCLVVPRTLLEQVGGFDDAFSEPGGGYANLEMFERLGHHPGVTVVSVLGEGSFHQVHGGTTTNVADAAARRTKVASYGRAFGERRGRSLQGLVTPVHYVGALHTEAARRTRSRRALRLMFDPRRDPTRPTTGPTGAIVPDELRTAAVEAAWDAGGWQAATWLGHPVGRAPADLHAYQELIARLGPEVVILVGDDAGLAGRAALASSVLDGLGRGRVVAVGTCGADVPAHPRTTAIVGSGDDAEIAREVLATAGDGPALVIIGLGAPERVVAAFEHYAPLVPVGGYVVVENTVVGGRPVAADFGPGPRDAVVAILAAHSDFGPDPLVERDVVTFNRGGYLTRLPS